MRSIVLLVTFLVRPRRGALTYIESSTWRFLSNRRNLKWKKLALLNQIRAASPVTPYRNPRQSKSKSWLIFLWPYPLKPKSHLSNLQKVHAGDSVWCQDSGAPAHDLRDSHKQVPDLIRIKWCLRKQIGIYSHVLLIQNNISVRVLCFQVVI